MNSLANIYAEALDWMSLSDIGYLPMYDYWVADAWRSAWYKKPAPAPPSLATIEMEARFRAIDRQIDRMFTGGGV